jgi:hypothetical protein
MRQFLTIVIAAGTLAATAFTVTSSGLVFTQVGAAASTAPAAGHG